MILSSGTKLGPYEILSAIGAGGMGEVYRARDTRLNRTVAIKVLPLHFSDNPEMKARFDREAQTVAGLNHPHICVLYDVGHQDGTDYLVMEYLEGQTLAQRLEKGALPLDEALKIASEIADALDKAHRQGVIHRDLKPSNVMLTKSGAKLLDFGLAKLKQETQQAPTLSDLPTNADVTAKGTILGTLQYMPPEQLDGVETDARTDIFAFGAVLYEMLSGKKAFEGKSQASLISAIMSSDPPAISSLQPMTPPAIDRVVKRCLAKDPEERWQTFRDLEVELKWISENGHLSAHPAAAVKRAGTRLAIWTGFAGLAAGLVIAAFALFRLNRPLDSSYQPGVRLVIPLSNAQQLGRGNVYGVRPLLALSPDGRRIVYVVGRGETTQLYIRNLNEFTARPIVGTDGGFNPFFSPNGQSVGFFTEHELKTVSLSGGTPVTLCEVSPVTRGGSWGEDGTTLQQQIEELEKVIGQQAVEIRFLKKLSKM